MYGKDDIYKIINFIVNIAANDDLKVIITAYEIHSNKGKTTGHIENNSLAGKNELKWAVDFIINRIDTEDLSIIQAAIEKRLDKKTSPVPVSMHKMADSMASGLQKQMNQISKSIRKSTRMLAADIILQHAPDIPDEHLKVLLDTWIPDTKLKLRKMGLTPELLIEMIKQFVAYSQGMISEQELQEYPEGWAKKYWNAFPEEVQQFIGSYLYNKIDSERFWEMVSQLL